MLFPYQQYPVIPTPVTPDGVVYRPEVRVRVIGPAGGVFLSGLVDTGADTTLLPLWVAESIGVSLDETAASQATGVTGHQLPVQYTEIELDVMQREERHRWRSIVGFVDYPPDVNETLLGRLGFLDQFLARFDTQGNQLELTPVTR